MAYAWQSGEYPDSSYDEPRQTRWDDGREPDDYDTRMPQHPVDSYAQQPVARNMPHGFNGPAHPLPSVRRSQIDYDQYLESPTAKFKIFSAEANRKRRKSVLRIIVIGAIVLAVILWVMFGRP